MEVKLFTWGGLKVTIIHDLILVGCLFLWIGFNVVFLSNDVKIGIPDMNTMKHMMSKR